MPMHDSVRDQVLHLMSRDLWFTESGGDVAAPTGHFSWTYTTADEIASLKLAFEDDARAAIGDEQIELFDWNELVGNWLLLENSEGNITVLEYATQDKARMVFEGLDKQYGIWTDLEIAGV